MCDLKQKGAQQSTKKKKKKNSFLNIKYNTLSNFTDLCRYYNPAHCIEKPIFYVV